MKIEIRTTKDENIVQITTLDERWYQNDKNGLIYPSTTWICGYYPKGIEYMKWLASKGWDEAEAIKIAAGDKGSKVHHAVEGLLKGQTLTMDMECTDSDGQISPLTVEEWEAVMSFSDWWKETKPKLVHSEQIVWNDEYRYAGTVDLVVEISGETWLLDLKTSKQVWPSHELQVSSYNHAIPKPADKIGILQVGYNRNKKKWKLTEVEDKFDLFLATMKIWAHENEGVFPKQKDYPRTIAL